jgi:hypothetical protein
MNWDSSVDIVTSLRAIRTRIRGLIHCWNNWCFSSSESHIRWVPGNVFPAGKRLGRQTTACYVSGDEISCYVAHWMQQWLNIRIAFWSWHYCWVKKKKKYIYIYIYIYISYIRQQWHLAGCVLTKNCTGIGGCNCYTFQLNCSTNCKWQLLSCVTIAFSERYVRDFINACVVPLVLYFLLFLFSLILYFLSPLVCLFFCVRHTVIHIPLLSSLSFALTL